MTNRFICILILSLLLLTEQLHAFVLYEGTKIWNQDSITFYFTDGTKQQKDEVKEFAKLWERYTGIKFKYTSKRPSNLAGQKYYRITFKGNKNESTTGAINGIIHFGNLSDNIIYRKTTILHEYGHMLGLGHEHQRSDRPASFENQSLIDACIENQNESRKWCKDNLFTRNEQEVFVASAYDANSIMHYEMDNITGKTNTTKDSGFWTNTHSLSYTDKYFIALLYNQDIADETLEKMHQQDLWQQQKFEEKANIDKERAIMSLSTSSCKVLKYKEQSRDRKYCDEGFMIIGTDDLSFPKEDFKTCYVSYKNIKDQMGSQELCQLSSAQLKRKRLIWRQQFAQYGQCKRLDTFEKNNQEYFCKEGFSFVTVNNDLIGDKTVCYGSEESAFQAMLEHEVCNMNASAFAKYQQQLKQQHQKRLTTRTCQVVNKEYERVNCPVDFNYTIVDKKDTSRPINRKCFGSEYQAINDMKSIPYCQN